MWYFTVTETDEKEEQALKEIPESGRWWNCHMDFIAEWTFEGSFETDREQELTETTTVTLWRICLYAM